MAWLRGSQALFPAGVTSLERLVAAGREAADQRLWPAVDISVDAADLGCVAAAAGRARCGEQRVNELDRLRKGRFRTSPKGMVARAQPGGGPGRGGRRITGRVGGPAATVAGLATHGIAGQTTLLRRMSQCRRAALTEQSPSERGMGRLSVDRECVAVESDSSGWERLLSRVADHGAVRGGEAAAVAWAADCAVAHSLTMQPGCVHQSLRSPVFLHFSLRCFSWSGCGVSAPEGVAGDRETAVPGEVRSADQRLKEVRSATWQPRQDGGRGPG